MLTVVISDDITDNYSCSFLYFQKFLDKKEQGENC